MDIVDRRIADGYCRDRQLTKFGGRMDTCVARRVVRYVRSTWMDACVARRVVRYVRNTWMDACEAREVETLLDCSDRVPHLASADYIAPRSVPSVDLAG
jgi:hypothetical protein